MGSTGGLKCSKYLLFTFNVIFWLGGCTILGLGIWLTVDSTIVRYVHLITISADDPHIETAAWLMIGLGVFVLGVGFVGCCGALHESKCMLCLYVLFLLIIILGEVTPGILVWVFKQYIVYDLLLEGMQAKMRSTYGNKTAFDSAWDFTQYELGCCGVLTSKDYENSVYFLAGGKYVPPSCCVPKKSLTRIQAFNITANDVLDYEKCLASAKDYIEGRAKEVDVKYIYEYLVSLVIACCLCWKIRSEDDDEEYYGET
ncbi:tetraspanin-18B-like isoform X2 [Lineus longissimus]|uniref:tetraspanin-18B-like isoform X2 n=1 Tax=Lineus longissimus TaxID=88925 RepID=UPI00315D9D3A